MAKKSKAKVFDNADVLPTPEREQHNKIETLETRKAGKRVRRVVDGTSLEYYRRHGTITPDQYDAGMRLYALWRQAGLEQGITSRMSDMPAGSGDSMASERAAHAFTDLKKLHREMGGHLYAIAADIACHNLMATEWAEKNGKSKRAAPDLMRLALDALVDAFKRL
jgi:hypothetical protein